MKNCKIIKEKLYVDYMYEYNVCVMYKVLQLACSCQKKKYFISDTFIHV